MKLIAAIRISPISMCLSQFMLNGTYRSPFSLDLSLQGDGGSVSTILSGLMRIWEKCLCKKPVFLIWR